MTSFYRSTNDSEAYAIVIVLSCNVVFFICIILLMNAFVATPLLTYNLGQIQLPPATVDSPRRTPTTRIGPNVQPAPTAQPTEEPITVSISADSSVWLNNNIVSREGLVRALDSLTHGDRDTRIFLRGDLRLSYGDVMQVMALLSAAGYRRVALMTQMPAQNPP